MEKFLHGKGCQALELAARTVVEPPSLEIVKKYVDDLRTWFGGGSGLMVGLDDLGSLLQP